MIKYPTMGEVIAECAIIIALALTFGIVAFTVWANLPHQENNMKRLHLENDTHFIEEIDDTEGMENLEWFKKKHSEFKGKEIKRVSQPHPENVPIQKLMENKK